MFAILLGRRFRFTFTVCLWGCLLVGSGKLAEATLLGSEAQTSSVVTTALEQFCFESHAGTLPDGDMNLHTLSTRPTFAERFKDWQKVVAMLKNGKMPPQEMPQPSEAQRHELIALIQTKMRAAARQQAGDPGQVVMRRLTSAEYAYSIQDLTELDVDFGRGFVSDAVGGEGFSNIGTVQFMQDSTLERYLEAAKRVADHAVIGAGPIDFHDDPGQTGLELSAIDRIQWIYRQHGFRTAAGEGGEPFGLDLYPKAFFAAWRYRHREFLELGDVTLAALAADEGVSARFAQHIWSVLQKTSPSYPTRAIVEQWQKLPVPMRGGESREIELQGRKQCDDLYEQMRDWQVRLAETASDREETTVLTEDSIKIDDAHEFRARIRWERGAEQATIELSVVSANPQLNVRPFVVWRNLRIRFRRENRRWRREQPLFVVIGKSNADALDRFSMNDAKNDELITTDTFSTSLTLPIPNDAIQAEVIVDVRLDVNRGDDCVVRCAISGGSRSPRTRPASALLGSPSGEAFKAWKAGVIEFARLLPKVSHREPAPSDRDPIPPPFDNDYNTAERNEFHYKIKYHRDDRFLVEKMLDDQTRQRLDDAWTDLLTSFDYHKTFLRFVAGKYNIDLAERDISRMDDAWLQQIPPEPRGYIKRLSDEYASMDRALLDAQPGHLKDVLRFTARAWRRPITDAENERLLQFYRSLRSDARLDHRQACRALLTRILVAPDFLYRTERPESTSGDAPLTDWELATRLSYFLWSSIPDDPLREVAATGELREPQQLAIHVRRMLRHSKARRMATEFFGQWFGFYQFDGFGGIDPKRFPEFTQPLKEAMHQEAIAFFEYIIRDDRPAREMLFAEYSFLNTELAAHYGVVAVDLDDDVQRVESPNDSLRGGLLGLGAVLTATSAPLRTSPVKRGDWVLRRVLGTSVPPPPADAGSIPADDVLGDGLTVRERLIAHRRDVTCANCHSRFDAFGFALENYDPLGRWRETYRDGRTIDTSGTLDDGTHIAGLRGLREYLRANEEQFYRTLSSKLIGYALGRGVLASDSALIERMVSNLRENDATLSMLVEEIVKSRQFRYHQGGANVSAGGEEPRASTVESLDADPLRKPGKEHYDDR